jgi:putative aldouronate transport system substrate-binding protein
MIKYFAGLYQEGLVDPELFTQDLAAWKAKGNKEQYGVAFAYGDDDFAREDRVMFPSPKRTHYEALPVLNANFNGAEPVWRRDGFGASILRTQVVITDKAENPATIIRWFDNTFELDNSLQIQTGLFDVKLIKKGEGGTPDDYEVIPETELSEGDIKKYEWGNMYTQSLPKYIPIGFRIPNPDEYMRKDIVDALYEPYLSEQAVPKAWLSMESSDRLKIIETDVTNYIERMEAEWIMGQSDVEEDWDGFLKELDRIGVAELTELRQAALDNVE